MPRYNFGRAWTATRHFHVCPRSALCLHGDPAAPRQNHFLSSGQCTAPVRNHASAEGQRQQPLSSERPPLKPVYTRASTRHEISGQQCLFDVHQPEIPEPHKAGSTDVVAFPSFSPAFERRRRGGQTQARISRTANAYHPSPHPMGLSASQHTEERNGSPFKSSNMIMITAHTHTKPEVHHFHPFACAGGDLPRRRPIGLVPMVTGSWWPGLQRPGLRTSAATAQLQRDARSNARRTKDFWPGRYQ